MGHRILVSRASVAGTTAAWWLSHLGNEVTVVERTPEFRDGGQNVDVRGVGRDVLRRMGLDQTALDHGTGEIGTAWVEADGRVAAQFVTSELGGDGPTAEMEILRGDLARLLSEDARAKAEFRFGDSIRQIEQDEDAAIVTFASGWSERFDAVVVAERVGSATRELVFPRENDPRWMDLTIAYFTIPRTADDDRLWRWYNAAGGRSVSLRPDHKGTTRAMLSIQQPPGGEQDWTADRQKAFLRERFADADGRRRRGLGGLRTRHASDGGEGPGGPEVRPEARQLEEQDGHPASPWSLEPCQRPMVRKVAGRLFSRPLGGAELLPLRRSNPPLKGGDEW